MDEAEQAVQTVERSIDRWLYNPLTGKFVTAFIGVAVIFGIIFIFQRLVTEYVKKDNARYRARKALNGLGYVLSVFFVLAIFSDRMSSFSTTLGVAGAGIAFALQEVIASIAGYFALSFSSFYKVGDRVQLGGIKGDVIDIGVLRTTLMEMGEWVNADLYTGRIVRIANSFVFKEPVFNYSGDFPFLWDEIKLPIKYGSDRHLTQEILERVVHETVDEYTKGARIVWHKMVKKFLVEEAKVGPMVTLVATDNWLEYTIRYVVAHNARRRTKNTLFNCIMDEIDQTNGRVAMASTTIHLVEMPALNVNMVGEMPAFSTPNPKP